MSYYSDTGEDFAAVDQGLLLRQQYLQQIQASSRVDRRYQNAEAARMRHVQRKKDRDGSYGGKFFDEFLEY